MKFLISFVLLVPLLASAGEGRQLPGGLYPQPGPNPRYCPEGTHRAWDEYKGRYICVKNDDDGVQPLPWPRQPREDRMNDRMIERMNGLKDALSGGARGAAYFDGSNAAAAGVEAVVPAVTGVPEARWKLVLTDPNKPLTTTTGKPRPALFLSGHDEARVVVAGGPVDSLGNALRDRNDKKLEDATRQQKDTEKRWKDYKEGKSVSPNPPTADETTTSRKG